MVVGNHPKIAASGLTAFLLCLAGLMFTWYDARYASLRTPANGVAFSTTARDRVPWLNSDISERNPVIFFHQRKAGGSSIRSLLANAAKRMNLTHFIPCVSPVPCDTYTFGGKRCAIYAGHFSISEVRHILRHVSMDNEFSGKQRHNFTCITNFRDPISRVESCFYYRFVTRGIRYKCINDVPVDTLRQLLMYGVDHYGDGCLDEPFRILSGVSGKRLLRKANDIHSSEFTVAFHNTMHWLQRCNILVMGDRRTFDLAGKLLPQLRDAFNHVGHENANSAAKCHLDEAHLSVITSLTEAERKVFHAVQQRVEYMLALQRHTCYS
jgi:hypothetical protein